MDRHLENLHHFHLHWALSISRAKSAENFWTSQYSSAAATQSVVIALFSKCILGTANATLQVISVSAQEHLLPSKSPHTVSLHTTASPRCSH